MKTLIAAKCPDSYRSDNPEAKIFDVYAADAADPIAPVVSRTSADDPDSIDTIDEAVRLTIADMPNALRVLENS